jgi:hypothetical protein
MAQAQDPIPPAADSVDSLRELQLDAQRGKRRALRFGEDGAPKPTAIRR